MHNRAPDDEKVPQCMVIGKPAPDVKYGADRIEESADDQQPYPFGLEQIVQRFPREHDQPSHHDVEQRGQDQKFFRKKRFEYDSAYR